MNLPSLETRRCAWCRAELPATAAPSAIYDSKKCRQSAFRTRRLAKVEEWHGTPMRMAYADPPYPGTARRYYQHEASYGGEVDHAELVTRLVAEYPDGWALSTSEKALRVVLAMCPEGTRVLPWVKPIGVPPATFGLHNTWEPLLVFRGRQRRGGRRDWLRAMPARGGGALPGRKPIAFVVFLFRSLGLEPGDTLDDLFPGTGIVGRCWEEVSRRSSATGGGLDLSPLQDGDGGGDLSLLERDDGEVSLSPGDDGDGEGERRVG